MASGRLILPLTEPVLDSSGDIAPGATLTVYVTGTTNLASLYADTGLSQAITNPQTSDAAGRFYAQASAIYADPGSAYDCKLTIPDGETFTWDGITLLAVAAGGGGAFMPISGGVFTGPVSGPTPAANDSSNLLATTAFVQTLVDPLAPLNSPNFSGTPTAPQPGSTALADQIATVGFVNGQASASNAANPGSLKIGSILIQWGRKAVSAGGEGTAITVNYLENFSNVPWTVVGMARDTSFNGANDMWLKGTGNPTASQAVFTTQASGEGPYNLAFVDWFAIGPA